MAHYDERSGDCEVLTFKEGLLSPMAHDLKLRVGRWKAEVDEAAGTVQARFEAASLYVASAMKEGREAPEALSASDRGRIEHNIASEVLEVARWPEILFRSTAVEREGKGYRVEGELTMKGRTRELAFHTSPEEGRQVARVRLHQPDWGIRPYTAMLGALKVQPDVEVHLALPLG